MEGKTFVYWKCNSKKRNSRNKDFFKVPKLKYG